MRPDARWWIDRLRAMTPAEVVHRGVRLARYPLELARAHAGVYDRLPRWLASWRGPTVCAEPPLEDHGLAAAEAYLARRQVLMGLGELELGDAPWHLEPSVGGAWPRCDAGRVIAAAPASFDPRTTWELNRGHGWVVLARAYAASRDARFRDRLFHELRGWRQANPVGFGINWVSAMEAAIRIHAFASIAEALRGDAPGADADVDWRLLAELMYQHAAFVARHLSRFSSANNHLIVELSGLVVAGHVLDVAAWRDRIAALADEAERQTFADGVNVEMATHYHMFVLEALVLVAWHARAHGAAATRIEAVIARMAAYLAAITLGSGEVLHHGDNDDGKILPRFAAAAPLLAAAHAPRPAPRSRWFRDGGQVVLRSARLHATLDAGPFGFGAIAAHAHCDALAVQVAFDDQPLLVERGTFRYHGDRAARDQDRGTAAHNTVQVGAREQADATGPFLWGRRPVTVVEHCALGEHDDVGARHDGFAPARHTRRVVRLGDTLAVVDRVDGADAPVTCRWHLAPGLDPQVLDDGFVIVGDRWLWFPRRPRITQTPHAARYLARQPAATLELTGDAMITLIGPELATRDAARRRLLDAIGAAP